MRKFTKSLLTLALLVLAVGGAKAQTETDIKDLQAANGTTEAWVASIPATYPVSPIDVKDSQTIFGSDASSQQTNANVNKYDYIYFEVVNFSTERACRIFFWDPNSNSRKDWYIRPVEGKESVSDWAAPASVTGNGTYCVKIPTGARLQGAKTPWVQTPEEGVLYQFSKVYVIEPADPLAGLKDLLQQAIDKGKLQNEFAKTTASWNTLQNAITDGETELANASATDESLTDATTAINDAIAGLKHSAGYARVTKNMFMEWDGDGADATALRVSPAGADNIGVADAGVPYGYGSGNVYWNHYTDLTPYEKLYALGTPVGNRARYLFNRPQDPGNPTGEGTGDFIQKYITIDEKGIAELALSDVSTEFVHLNTFKRPDAGTTFTDFIVYAAKSKATISAAGYATFSSIMNVDMTGVTAYAAKVNGATVSLTPVTEVPANTGVIIEATEGTYNLTNIESADAISDNDLLISDGSVAGDGTIYVLANKNSVVGFYKLATGEKVPAGKGYLKVTSSAPEFLPFDGNTTGIESVKAAESKGEFFNLAGQRVAQPAKGLYIVNGKKVIFK